jgi:hypothetical protein
MATVPHEESHHESYVASEEGSSKERPSTLSLFRNVVLDLTQVVEDSMELVGASVREELAEFRVEMARQLLWLVAVVIGGVLATAGLAMLVQQWIGYWPGTLLIFGGVYLSFAAGIYWGRSKSEPGDWK